LAGTSSIPPPFDSPPDGTRVRIRLTPKAGANRIGDVVADADGYGRLKVQVSAVPEKGKANKALLKLLSKSWGVGMRRLDLIAGAKDRNKTVRIAGEPAETLAMLDEWLQGRNKE